MDRVSNNVVYRQLNSSLIVTNLVMAYFIFFDEGTITNVVET